MIRTTLVIVAVCALLAFGMFFSSYVSAASAIDSKSLHLIGPVLPESAPMSEKVSPLGHFVINVPWKTEAVVCDGVVDPMEWSDASRYDISDTSGQGEIPPIPDPLGTVDLYVKQDSSGVWFAVINHGDSTLEQYDEICLAFDDDFDGCFPYYLTNEGNLWVFYSAISGTDSALWRWWQDEDCNAQSYVCAGNLWDYYDVSLACCGIGLTNGRVSYEVMVPYGVLDHYIEIDDPVKMDMGFYIYVLDYGSANWQGEWPSQGRYTTYKEPCYYGKLACGSGWYFKPGYPEYAISGMPDFDQKYDSWDNPPGSGNWTHCGPVAIANCLWWFDSKYQWLINPDSPLPPAFNDDFPLVFRYGSCDDHCVVNAPPLVEDLAWHMDTDGKRTADGSIGTNVFEMEAAIAEWFLETETDTIFYKHTKKAPDFFWIEGEIERCEDVILLLGFWQEYGPDEWFRVGGHYVTCAGVNSDSFKIALSDPFYDMAELGWPGRVGDGILPTGWPHDPGHGPLIHFDAGNVSHDYYMVLHDSLSPGGPWSILEYPPDDSVVRSLQFANCPPEFLDLQTTYNEGLPVHTEIEFAVAISPIVAGWHIKGEYPDYAPDGMPDFDQNQRGWQKYCGPTAVANCLWWFDSKYQWLTTDGNPPPPFVQDDFNLVTSYIAGFDDHSYQKDGIAKDNVQYLIEDLAGRMGTSATGTHIDSMKVAINEFLQDKGLDGVFYTHSFIDSTKDPEFFNIIEEEIECCQDVILLLGFWQHLPTPWGYWRRVGGHYVTCAGVNSDSMWIMFSDPDFDQQRISYPADPKWHNNAALVSHDVYDVAPSPSPGGYYGLPGYPQAVALRHAFQNCPDYLLYLQYFPDPMAWVYTEIEAGVFISPYAKPVAVENLQIYTDGSFADVNDVRLVWSPVTEDTAGCPAYIDYYVIYRDTKPYFTPGPSKVLATTTGTAYEDVDAAGNTAINHYYVVNARVGPYESDNSRRMGEFDKYLIGSKKGSVQNQSKIKHR